MSAASAAPATTESRSPETWSRRREWTSYGRRNPTLIAGLTIITVIVIFGLLAPFIIDQDATRTTAFSKDLLAQPGSPAGHRQLWPRHAGADYRGYAADSEDRPDCRA